MQDLTFTDDLEIKNGDFSLSESDDQHVQHILIANKGEFKKSPELGVGMELMLNSEDPMDFLIEAKKNLEHDGLKVKNISFTDQETLNIDAKYIQ
ncbi:hypothetical protein [Chryseobacterium daeguense]|uniref:hypothetical protein n=1 Tax=Chryseobacterium daeguense TaxID=412438 RepID=UPI00042994F3|nr:hypothetical protein [Chryseobacterium daeguense]